jgi:methylated-DNA-[protein]-cysteine S-methyltransferase
MILLLERMGSPIGTIFLIHDGEAVRALDFEDYESRMHQLLRLHYGSTTLVPASGTSGFVRQMQGYFEGDLTILDRIPVQTGGTAFQRQV